MVKCGVLFEVRTETLYIICTSFGFKGLTSYFSGNIMRTMKEVAPQPMFERVLEADPVLIGRKL
jgi:hypothetical protein